MANKTMYKILVIEDETVLSDNISSALRINNYDVYTAENGKTGLELAEKILPDLILCDIMMPVNDGYWVLENVRANDQLMQTPFIFITAKVERDDLRKGMELGADDYLTKPFKIVELLKAIEVRLLKRFQQKNAAVEKSVKVTKIDADKFVLLDTGKNIERVLIGDIECILADNMYTEIILKDNRQITIRKSLSEWESLLPENIFLRVHRGTIINLTQVKKIEKWYNQTMIVHLQNYNKPITMSRSYTTKFKGKLII